MRDLTFSRRSLEDGVGCSGGVSLPNLNPAGKGVPPIGPDILTLPLWSARGVLGPLSFSGEDVRSGIDGVFSGFMDLRLSLRLCSGEAGLLFMTAR